MNISRHSFIFGLSYALDILGRNNLSHSKSTAYLSALMAREIGLSEEDTNDIYYAALLHDIGIADEYITGRLSLKDLVHHCEIGEKMLRKLPLPEIIPKYVLYHHEYYNGRGVFELPGDEIPLGAQIICLASDFDDLFGKSGNYDKRLIDKAYGWLEGRKEQYNKEITDVFTGLMHIEYFLLDYFNHETKYAMSKMVITNDDVYFDIDDVKKFALCFAEIIDQRSPFTFSHSTGIAHLAHKAARYLGYDDETQSNMYIAGLLHDIGKLHISLEILHKNAGLTPEERFEINKHTYYTRKILEQIQGFEEIVDLAANHHEKPNGKGYPYHLKGDRLGELERVMSVCDVFQALTEERPYRSPLPAAEVWSIIDDMASDDSLDKSLIEKLKLVFV